MREISWNYLCVFSHSVLSNSLWHYSPPGSPVHEILQARILGWVDMPSSRGSSQPRDRTQLSHISSRFFTIWAPREAQEYWSGQPTPSPEELPDPGIKLGSPALQLSYQGSHSITMSWKVSSNKKESALIHVTSVQFSCSVVSSSLWPHGLQHARLPCPSPAFGAYSNSCPQSWWCHPTISFSAVPFSSWLQFFPSSGSFPKSQFFASGGQSIGVSASVSVFPKNIQEWFPLGWTGWISLQSKGLSSLLQHHMLHDQSQNNYAEWKNTGRKSKYCMMQIKF